MSVAANYSIGGIKMTQMREKVQKSRKGSGDLGRKNVSGRREGKFPCSSIPGKD